MKRLLPVQAEVWFPLWKLTGDAWAMANRVRLPSNFASAMKTGRSITWNRFDLLLLVSRGSFYFAALLITFTLPLHGGARFVNSPLSVKTVWSNWSWTM